MWDDACDDEGSNIEETLENAGNITDLLDTADSASTHHNDDEDHSSDDSIKNENLNPIVIPLHNRCGNHSLNLVASVDTFKAREDRVYQRSYDRATSKVQALSNAVNHSPKQNDAVEAITGTTFLQPVCTR